MLRAVRSLHFYRKVPHDVTEATLAGGVMSVLAVLAMGTLAVQHISHFAEVALDTKVEVDEFADQPLRIEFNVRSVDPTRATAPPGALIPTRLRS